MTTLPARADIVIIGAGLAGAATAHALASLGFEAIVIERHASPSLESSGRSAGMVRQDADDPDVEHLLRAGALAHRSGRLATFRATGSFLIGRTAHEGEIDGDVSERIPLLRGRGAFVPTDGVVDVAELMASLLAGRAVVTGASVRGIRDTVGELVVSTDAGDVRSRLVVNAAGAHAGRIGSLPLRSLKRHVFLTQPRATSEQWPFAWDVTHGLYLRARGDSLLLCACDEREGEPGDNAVEGDAAAQMTAAFARWQPGVLPIDVRSSWAGQRTFAPDNKFVIGWDPRMRGLFHVAGLGGHGVTASPAIGRLAASMLAAGPDAGVPAEALPFAPARLLSQPIGGSS